MRSIRAIWNCLSSHSVVSSRRKWRCQTAVACEVLEPRTLLSTLHIDSGFGDAGTGRVALTISRGTEPAVHLTTGNQGEILASLYVNGVPTIYRFLANGIPDAEFGTSGRVTLHGQSQFIGYTLVQQRDGKFVVLGAVAEANAYRTAVARFLSDGSLDSTFGVAGVVTLPGHPGFLPGNGGVALQADGKIVVASNGRFGASLFRLNWNGTLDSGFGTGGMATGWMPMFSTANVGLAVRDDGRIAIAGMRAPGTLALALVNPDGTLEVEFGNNGVALSKAEGWFRVEVAMQPDGKLLVGKRSHLTFEIQRFNRDGTLDTSFQSAGSLTLGPDRLPSIFPGMIFSHRGIIVGSTLRYNFLDSIAINTVRIDLVVQRFSFGKTESINRATQPNEGIHLLAAIPAGREMDFLSVAERASLTSRNWLRDYYGSDYVFVDERVQGVEEFHLYNTYTASHVFTQSTALRDSLLSNQSFNDEWIFVDSFPFTVPDDFWLSSADDELWPASGDSFSSSSGANESGTVSWANFVPEDSLLTLTKADDSSAGIPNRLAASLNGLLQVVIPNFNSLASQAASSAPRSNAGNTVTDNSSTPLPQIDETEWDDFWTSVGRGLSGDFTDLL